MATEFSAISNSNGYQPFQVNCSDLGKDAIQVDVSGSGILAYSGKLTQEIEIEFHTVINNALRVYGYRTGHDTSSIGYYLELSQSNKYNRSHCSYEAAINLTIVYQKPVKKATCYQLLPTTQLLATTILSSIFLLPKCSQLQ